jgi:hypothetical protein
VGALEARFAISREVTAMLALDLLSPRLKLETSQSSVAS